ncbi:MAG TPA: transglycosylase domain-containing protein, partial [Ktedonobacteraceae bacterium]|nr:transglycosylase domain-containing protein [Ktedonobacteraceae bacterium]
MDEYNGRPNKEIWTLVPAGSTGNEVANGYNRGMQASPAVYPATHTKKNALSTTPAKLDEQNFAPHRTHINRIILRKRRQERINRRESAVPRLLTMIVVIFAVLLTLLTGSAGGAFAYYQSQLPLLNGMANHTLFQSTRIYDRKGRLLYELFDPKYGRRTYVNYNDVSPFLVSATVAAEDHTFWQNNGVDFQGILRAAVANLQNQTVVEGGSTITQQLIKNQLFLNQPRSFQIKAEEALLAYG